ncbi:MAG: hypothetical protein M3R22_11450, partial [Pseudomonadota bacterium]|nr:hypothetical protein [Pseudomonadota bacterium]
MIHDDTLKPMGTQTPDSVQVEAAHLAKVAKERAEATAVAEAAQKVGDRGKVAADMATQLVKDDPIKAMLIAAAAGALLM